MANEHNDVEERMLEEARSEVAYADHKASLLLASLGIGFGAVLGGLLAGNWGPSDQGAGETAWWAGAVVATAAVVLAAAAVWPRYSKKSSGATVYFWGHAAAAASLQALCEHLDEHAPEPRARTRHQLWHLSRIVTQKYALVRAAFVAAAFAVTLFIISAILAA